MDVLLFAILPLILVIGIWALMFYIFYRVIKAAVKSALLEVKMEERRMAGGYGQGNPYQGQNPGYQGQAPGFQGQNPGPGYGQAPEQEFQPERMGGPPTSR